jgi:acyl-CoA thioesterase YciA
MMTTEKDANVGGDIFGGWLLAQMDLAGGMTAYAFAQNKVVTAGIHSMSFHHPVFIGDELSIFTDINRIGTTSITIKIEAWIKRKMGGQEYLVTEGLFTFVAIDKDRKPIQIDPDLRSQPKKEGL